MDNTHNIISQLHGLLQWVIYCNATAIMPVNDVVTTRTVSVKSRQLGVGGFRESCISMLPLRRHIRLESREDLEQLGHWLLPVSCQCLLARAAVVPNSDHDDHGVANDDFRKNPFVKGEKAMSRNWLRLGPLNHMIVIMMSQSHRHGEDELIGFECAIISRRPFSKSIHYDFFCQLEARAGRWDGVSWRDRGRARVQG
jgi:hypothetical protein